MKTLPLKNCCFIYDLLLGAKIIVFSELLYLAFCITLLAVTFPIYEEICMVACRAVLFLLSGLALNALKKRQLKWLKAYIYSKIALELVASAQYMIIVLVFQENDGISYIINKIILRIVLILLIQIYIIVCLFSIKVMFQNQEIWPAIQKQLESDPSVTYQQIIQIRSNLERGNFGIARELYEKFTQKMLAAEIKEISTMVITEANQEENKECSICLGEFKNQETVKILICKHYFHTQCIEEWLKMHIICPLCRTNQRKELK